MTSDASYDAVRQLGIPIGQLRSHWSSVEARRSRLQHAQIVDKRIQHEVRQSSE
jgi:hypothetical protein